MIIISTVRGILQAQFDHVFSGDDLRSLMAGEVSAEVKRKMGAFARLATKVGAASGITTNLGLTRRMTHYWVPLGQRVVVIGGELVGIELAEFLHEWGREVTVVGEEPRRGRGLTLLRRMRILAEPAEHSVALHSGYSQIEIERQGVKFVDAAGTPHSVRADTVIVAQGARGDLALAQRLEAAGFRVMTVGDANGVGYTEGAISSAADAVQQWWHRDGGRGVVAAGAPAYVQRSKNR